jgi:flagellar basal-body rod protein FlgF
MDPLLSILAAGMDARTQSLNQIANNLANVSSPGYKVDRDRFSTYLSAAAADAALRGESAAVAEMPLLDQTFTEFRQGSLQETARPTDVALQGEGFFTVETDRGLRYTRSGNFQLANDGELRTREGYRVRVKDTEQRDKLKADPRLPINIDGKGFIWQEGRRLGALELTRFERPELMQKEEGVYFAALPGMTPKTAEANVASQSLEASNVDPAEASMALVGVSREFQLLNRALNVVLSARRGLTEQVAKW